MKKGIVPVILFAAIAVITLVVLSERNSARPGSGPANPYAYDAGEFALVDSTLVTWKETRQILLDDGVYKAIAYQNDKIYLLASGNLQILNNDGARINTISLQPDAESVGFMENGNIIVGYQNFIAILNNEGSMIRQSEPVAGNPKFTSIARLGENIYVADGINRKVLVYNPLLEKTGEFKGESGISEIHGFIVPSTRFALGVNKENELWITNPGLHTIQNYTATGNLRSFIGTPSFGIEGFSGCCNPVNFTFLPGGGFITSEKGIIRVKVLKESGELASVVAPPEKFAGGTLAPDVAVDSRGNVLLLDFDRSMIRFFEPI